MGSAGLTDAATAAASNTGYMGSLSVVFYLLTSLTLTLMNKLIFSQFQFPLFVTEFQVPRLPSFLASTTNATHPCLALLARSSASDENDLVTVWLHFFHWPGAIPSQHQLIVSMAMLVVLGEISRLTGALSVVPPVSIEMGKSMAIAPVTMLFVTMLSFTNYCLRHVDIGFYQVLLMPKHHHFLSSCFVA